MVKVLVDVSSSDARLRVTLCAQSIKQAVEVVSARYPGSEVGVVFPIEPDTFFTEGGALVSETLRPEMPRAGTVQ